MGARNENQPRVQLFFALMFADAALFQECEQRLIQEFGPIAERDAPYAFDPLTNYYAPEFGTGLTKRLIASEILIPSEDLAGIKIRTNEIESEMAGYDGGAGTESLARNINIDPGYLCHSKVVLATTKDHAHRIYVGRGIFEEVTLNYRKADGGYRPHPWTYPDYRMPERLAFFGRLRDEYRRRLDDSPSDATPQSAAR
jgi:hypothetical protein